MEDLSPGGTADFYEEYKVYGNKYPTAEEALFRMAIDKVLTDDQQRIWEYWNYDKLTQNEISKKMHKSRSAITQQIRTIESHLTTWCKEHLEVYNLLKELE